jgi:hypothetical protein
MVFLKKLLGKLPSTTVQSSGKKEAGASPRFLVELMGI